MNNVFFYFDLYLNQEQYKTCKLCSNEFHGFKRPLRAFELEKKQIMARKC